MFSFLDPFFFDIDAEVTILEFVPRLRRLTAGRVS